MSATESFNLIDEPWIPVLWRDGRTDRVGIRATLTQAGRIRQIAASNPMDNVAVLRFLLALLYWCKGNPPNAAPAQGSSFPPDWFKKLDEHREYFNLLGGGKRFYQCLPPTRRDSLSANYLVQEIPTGTNAWHFRHSTDGAEGLCPACCAMGLLRLPLFATSGGRGKPPGINAKPPLYVIPVGQSLAATLRLSWRPAPHLGTPAWQQPDVAPPSRGEVPLLTGLTWLPRRVWLDDPDGPEAHCIACATKTRLIHRCVFAGSGSTRAAKDAAGWKWQDPHVLYQQSGKGLSGPLHASDALKNPDAASRQWAEILAEILRDKRFPEEAVAWVVGFATVQNDKYLEATEWYFPGPASSRPESLVDDLRGWRKQELGRRCFPRQQKEKPSSTRHVEMKAAFAAIRPHVESAVCARAADLLVGGTEAWEDAAQKYAPMMEALALSLAPGFTTAALKRRRGVERVMPDMRSRRDRNDTRPGNSGETP
ncbi:MAG: type I-E CRISPR-associated protein Cse1/CasA [Thermoguttaceae bacterium]|jgi:CRISPR type I-E-associated protein CasA/Cse1|nr:type I-E CRISPR-associated protein Cse1/CasA [Thermoguttaceae bacterium]